MDAAGLLPLIAVAVAALLASALAAVAGFGGAAILLPALVWAFGVRDAIPILTIVQLVGNLSRVVFNRRRLVMPVVGWFSLGAVPLAVVGGLLFASAPAPFLSRLLGGFFIAIVAFRHTTLGKRAHLGLRGFAPLGAAAGLISALVGTVGPFVAPFFLSYGLAKGAYIGTEALTAVVMHVVKLVVYGGAGVLSVPALLVGMPIGALMVLGTYVGTRLLDRVPPGLFPLLIEGVLIASGLQMLLRPG